MLRNNKDEFEEIGTEGDQEKEAFLRTLPEEHRYFIQLILRGPVYAIQNELSLLNQKRHRSLTAFLSREVFPLLIEGEIFELMDQLITLELETGIHAFRTETFAKDMIRALLSHNMQPPLRERLTKTIELNQQILEKAHPGSLQQATINERNGYAVAYADLMPLLIQQSKLFEHRYKLITWANKHLQQTDKRGFVDFISFLFFGLSIPPRIQKEEVSIWKENIDTLFNLFTIPLEPSLALESHADILSAEANLMTTIEVDILFAKKHLCHLLDKLKQEQPPEPSTTKSISLEAANQIRKNYIQLKAELFNRKPPSEVSFKLLNVLQDSIQSPYQKYLQVQSYLSNPINQRRGIPPTTLYRAIEKYYLEKGVNFREYFELPERSAQNTFRP